MIIVKRTEADERVLAGIPVNPDDLKDDGVDYLNIRINKPWGHEIERYRDDKCSVTWLHIHSGQQTSMHCHPGKTTLLMIVGGEATLSTLSGFHQLGAGDMVIIEKGAFHKTTSNGEPVVLYEMEAPPNKRDLVRLEDAYGRKQGYEKIERPEIDRPEMGTGL